jgi:hypothetical protein
MQRLSLHVQGLSVLFTNYLWQFISCVLMKPDRETAIFTTEVRETLV